MEKRKIILDCDPGHDDAIAMLMAARHPAIELLGITVVAGNQTLEKNIVNALNVCQLLGIDCSARSDAEANPMSDGGRDRCGSYSSAATVKSGI